MDVRGVLRTFTAAGAVVLVSGSLGAAPSQAQLARFPIPSSRSQPIAITLGPDGNLWFTEQNTSRIARVTPGGAITEFRTPSESFPGDIAPGPGGVWFTEGADGKVGVADRTGRIREVTFSRFDAAGGITKGPDGNVWFTDETGNRVWRIDLPSGALHSFAVPTPDSFPSAITTGPDGNLWFLELSAGKLARITPAGVITEFPHPLQQPYDITTGPDGNLWITEEFVQQIDKVTTAGAFTTYTTSLHTLGGISPGPGDRTLWFASFGDDTVASISTDGVVTAGPTIDASEPTDLAVGPGGSVWILGYNDNSVYRLVP